MAMEKKNVFSGKMASKFGGVWFSNAILHVSLPECNPVTPKRHICLILFVFEPLGWWRGFNFSMAETEEMLKAGFEALIPV